MFPIFSIVASSGILITLGISFAGIGSNGPNFDKYPFCKTITDIGAVSFSMVLSIFSGFIAMAIANKPRLLSPGLLAIGLFWGVFARESRISRCNTYGVYYRFY
ncbi:hypothetical protein BmIO_00402 [Borrelia miyamotoi]|nr:hypothetical protein BmIO_00402 [Borrelia miyamotoi]